jgi:hypothetical protein
LPIATALKEEIINNGNLFALADQLTSFGGAALSAQLQNADLCPLNPAYQKVCREIGLGAVTKGLNSIVSL